MGECGNVPHRIMGAEVSKEDRSGSVLLDTQAQIPNNAWYLAGRWVGRINRETNTWRV